MRTIRLVGPVEARDGTRRMSVESEARPPQSQPKDGHRRFRMRRRKRPRPGLSLRAYARHRKLLGLPGGSLSAVQKAISSGRVLKNEAGRIDVADADLTWELFTNPLKQIRQISFDLPLYVPIHAAFEDRKAVYEIAGDVEHMPRESHPARDLLAARAVREIYAARLAEMKYDKLVGKLIDRVAVEESWITQAITIKNCLLAIPSKLKASAPDLSRAQIDYVEKLIYDALENLARGNDELDE
jgi:hypothetical protein